MVLMRYFVELSYRGTDYSGWQRQPNSLSVQQVIEEALALVLRQETPVVGCGRTDTGVHASYYVLHFDSESPVPEWLLYRLNRVLPADIAIHSITAVQPEAHARFDALQRAYTYRLSWRKDPFRTDTAWLYQPAEDFSPQLLSDAAELLFGYQHFFPFCKTGSDARTMECRLLRSEWEYCPDQGMWLYHIAANRFLRGMVRLIVGMCVNVARKKLSLETVRVALDRQERLVSSESAPPEGLFLTEVCYASDLFQGHQPEGFFPGRPGPAS